MKEEEFKPKAKKPYKIEVITRIGKIPVGSIFLWKDLPLEVRGIYEQYKDNLTANDDGNILSNSMFRVYLNEEVK